MSVVSSQDPVSLAQARWRLLQWALVLGAFLLVLPGVVIRLCGIEIDPRLASFVFGLCVVGAAFLLAWAAEVAQHDMPRALALTLLALIAVLPEYAVDAYLAWHAAEDPVHYGPLALANMTGANRLLIGVAWPLVTFLYWARLRWSRRDEPERDDPSPGAVVIGKEQGIEVACLALATLYSFVIPAKGTLSLLDLLILAIIFGFYCSRVAKGSHHEPDLIGPARVVGELPAPARRTTVAVFFLVAGFVIALAAEPFAESLIHAGAMMGYDRRTLIQWLAPLASEAPEFIITSIFAWRLMADASLGALVSSKVNQWTLLVSSIPLVFNIASWRLGKALPAALSLNDIQRQDLLLTSAQSLFAVSVLLGLRLSTRSAGLLFCLFAVQFLVPAFVVWMTGMYLALSVAAFIKNRRQIGLLIQEVMG
jgi:cation:H+ antiporter